MASARRESGVEEKTNQLLYSMLQASTELVLELATSDCEKIAECPIAKKAREIAKVMKEFNQMREEIEKAMKRHG